MSRIRKLWLAKEKFRKKRTETGFTLVETLVGLVVILIVLLGLAMFMQSVFVTQAENKLRNIAMYELKACADALRIGSECCKSPKDEGGYKVCEITPEGGSISFELKYKIAEMSDSFYNATIGVSYSWHGNSYVYNCTILYLLW